MLRWTNCKPSWSTLWILFPERFFQLYYHFQSQKLEIHRLSYASIPYHIHQHILSLDRFVMNRYDYPKSAEDGKWHDLVRYGKADQQKNQSQFLHHYSKYKHRYYRRYYSNQLKTYKRLPCSSETTDRWSPQLTYAVIYFAPKSIPKTASVPMINKQMPVYWKQTNEQ